MTPRLAALRVVLRVLGDGVSLSEALPRALEKVEPRARPQVQALSFGTLRWHRRLQAILECWMDKPLRAKDQDVAGALCLGLFELIHMNTPDYAVIQQTAELARELRKPWAVGLINGVLRRAQREMDACASRVDRDPAIRHALPDWLYERIAAAYGDATEVLCTAMNRHPPMTLRVNLARSSREDYRARLVSEGIQASAHPWVDSALVLDEPVPVDHLRGFAQGLVSVQDAAAQLAAPLLECRPGQRVLDACAAPGGKTLHLLEQADGDLDLLALDKDADRLARVEENLQRGAYRARLLAADAACTDDWHDGRPFDRILLDAPCSATGVIRRHPDIKWLRRDADIPVLARSQAQLLRALWPLLAQGGMLLYVTCSLLPEENAVNVARFLQEEPSAKLLPLDGIPAGDGAMGRQIQVGEEGMDGFYYARLKKC